MQDMQMKKYSRQIMLPEIGESGQQKLLDCTVGIVGAGGLGSPSITALAAMGIGKLVIIDRDVIDKSNLHRQTIYTEKDVGESKSDVAARKTSERYGTKTVSYAVSINDTNAKSLLRECDLVIDGLDSVDARYAINRACVSLEIPLISGAAVGTTGQIFSIVKGSACYRCMFPNITNKGLQSCSLDGVHPAVLLATSSIQIAEAVRIITGKKPLLADSLMYVNIDTYENIKIPIRARKACIDCGTNRIDPKPSEISVKTLCSRASGGRSFAVVPAELMKINIERTARKMKLGGMYSCTLSPQKTVICLHEKDMDMSITSGGTAVATGFKTKEDVLKMYNSLEFVI